MSDDFNGEDFDRTVLISDSGSNCIPENSCNRFATICSGCTVGNYRVLKPLSEGGMGKIFLCHPLDDFDSRVVLKVLKSEIGSKGSGKLRFRREFQLLQELEHENIVRTYDSWHDSDAEFFVMEYVSGLNLAQMVQLQYIFSVEYGIYMMGVLAQAFRYAWDTMKLLHRDIKPSNIMISDDNVIKILDFGIAKSLLQNETVLTLDGTSLGSPGFMSPEQYDDPKNIDCTSDIFSLGATVYYCLSGGQLPYGGNNLAEIVMSMRRGYAIPLHELNPEVPENFSDLIMATLNIDPERRPFCWAKLLASIDRVSKGGRMVK